MLLIYNEKNTSRARYAFDLYFNELLGVSFQITANRDEFIRYEGPKLNYSKQPFGEELFIASTNILFERGITGQKITHSLTPAGHILYPTYHRSSALPFDPFAAGFYLVSRYEEYLPYMKDEYGRFSAKESLAYEKGFLQQPLVNHWARDIARLIGKKHPGFIFPVKKFRFLPTIDVDAAFAYRHKGIFRTAGGYLNSLLTLDFKEIAERTKVNFGWRKDPFDTFQYHRELQKKHQLKVIFFILFADYGLNDKNIPVTNLSFQRLIKSLADYAEIGIHPSFSSDKNPHKLKTEVERLSQVLNWEITKSRQHFLLLNLPSTYRNLINLGITDDYSMGFASQPGFRAGICDSFYFYDLELETKTPLRVHPFTLMDGTLRDYMNISREEAADQIDRLIQTVKQAEGTFISIWHNESLSDAKRWAGWREIYEQMIFTATQ
ncbi:MAG: polysaccharide deacetylase family protein [Bacteroidales bacterium]|nr:polysaccharide deacetylase family protein [Bacteroidales bacterium]